MQGKFDIFGHTVRTHSTFRYVAFCGRAATEIDQWDYREQRYDRVTLDAQAPWIAYRSDDIVTAKAKGAKKTPRAGYCVVVDTHTGKQTVA